MAADIKFIAHKAGVSIATVSRVLNGSKRVSEPLRARVMEEVQRYGYRPNVLARGLITNRTDLVGVVLPNVSDMYHAGLLSSIERCAERYGYNVIVSNVYSDFEREKKSFGVFGERKIDGILLLHENTPAEMAVLCDLVEVPIVLVNVNVPDSPLPCVGIDERQAAYDAVSYLARIGHRNIAAILGDGYSLGTLRRQGYIDALAAAGLAFEADYVKESACTIAGGAGAVQELMLQKNLPTAIFCVTDEIAIGAMEHLAKLGYRVPQDVSVFGFDNIALGQIIRPHLSTVNQPVEEIGEKAMKLLAALMRQGVAEAKVETGITLGHNLVLRESCAAPE